jgi:CDGSH-type Zn-finger protein
LQATHEDGRAAEAISTNSELRIVADGPHHLSGDIEMCDGSCERLARETRLALWRCGASKNKPYCDRSDLAIGFKSKARFALGASQRSRLHQWSCRWQTPRILTGHYRGRPSSGRATRRSPGRQLSVSTARSDDRRHRMEMAFHRFPELFAQLGLDSDLESIRSFIATHSPLPGDERLEDAPFWTPAQARMLQEALIADADWAEVVDRLNLALRTG